MEPGEHDLLSLVSLLSSRISHALRTPLATAVAAIDDLHTEPPFPAAVWGGAVAALRSQLELIAGLAVHELPHTRFNLTELIAECAAAQAVPMRAAAQCTLSGDERLWDKAIRLLLEYFAPRIPYAGPAPELFLELKQGLVTLSLQGGFELAEADPRARSLAALAQCDHRLPSLTLLFVEGLLRRHGGTTAIYRDGVPRLIITFPAG